MKPKIVITAELKYRAELQGFRDVTPPQAKQHGSLYLEDVRTTYVYQIRKSGWVSHYSAIQMAEWLRLRKGQCSCRKRWPAFPAGSDHLGPNLITPMKKKKNATIFYDGHRPRAYGKCRTAEEAFDRIVSHAQKVRAEMAEGKLRLWPNVSPVTERCYWALIKENLARIGDGLGDEQKETTDTSKTIPYLPHRGGKQ